MRDLLEIFKLFVKKTNRSKSVFSILYFSLIYRFFRFFSNYIMSVFGRHMWRIKLKTWLSLNLWAAEHKSASFQENKTNFKKPFRWMRNGKKTKLFWMLKIRIIWLVWKLLIETQKFLENHLLYVINHTSNKQILRPTSPVKIRFYRDFTAAKQHGAVFPQRRHFSNPFWPSQFSFQFLSLISCPFYSHFL